ncbi:flippase [uncultured Thiodictyon sp.]|jgi:O-antigen/teichoic acid export membrane protein|uniref:flippase n=1 Tax=uncultured Thiodictyon sp. TaxID=1846217 RepID=UPI0025EBB1A0|nr:flippase [uncultured Thiodictyon sp.]
MSIRRDTLYNLSGQLIPLAVTLVTLPTFLGLIGAERYGALAIVWVLLGYMGLFDLGMSRATAQRVAQLDQASSTERAAVVWTALVVITALGSIAGLVMWTVGQLVFSNTRPGAAALQVELYCALPWLSLALPVTLSASALAGALQGREKFLSLNVVQVLVTSLALVLPLAAAAAGYTALDWLIPATLAPRVLGIVLLFALCRRHVPLTAPIAFDAGRLRSLLGYGGWISVTAVLGPLLAVADRVIIATVLGASAVTFYAIPQGLVARGIMLAGSLSGAIFPRFAVGTRSDRDDLMGSALQGLALIITPTVFVAIWLTAPLLHLWLGPDVAAQSVPVAEVLLLGLWFNSLAYIPCARLQGAGDARTVAVVHLAELVPYALLLCVLLWTWGILGAALAWVVRVAIDAVLLLTLSGAEIRDYGLLVAPVIMIFCSTAMVSSLPPSSPMRWTLFTLLLGAMALWTARRAPNVFRRVLPPGRVAAK